jgi:hypothetical protein
MSEAIAAWHDFYSAAANASAALVGLVFVGLSIRVAQGRVEASAEALGLGSVTDLLYPLYVSLAMLIPTGAPVVHGVALLVPAVVCFVDLGFALRLDRRGRGRLTPLNALYRYVLPLSAALILALGALGIIAGWEVALYAPLAFVAVMFIAGSHNAWTLLLASQGGGRRSPTTVGPGLDDV